VAARLPSEIALMWIEDVVQFLCVAAIVFGLSLFANTPTDDDE
jgi:hypothetical protein